MAKRQERDLRVVDRRGYVVYQVDDPERASALSDELARFHPTRVERVGKARYALPNGSHGVGLSKRQQVMRFMSELGAGSGAALALARARAGTGRIREENVYETTREDARLLSHPYWPRPRERAETRESNRKNPRGKAPARQEPPKLGGVKSLSISTRENYVATPLPDELPKEERRKIWQPPVRDLRHTSGTSSSRHSASSRYKEASDYSPIVVDDGSTTRSAKQGKNKKRKRRRRRGKSEAGK